MSTENVLPDAEQSAGAGEAINAESLPNDAPQIEGEQKQEGESESKDKDDGKTERERELERQIKKLERRIDSKTKRTYSAEAELAQLRQSLKIERSGDTVTNEDGERVTLTPAELEKLIEKRAESLAPKVADKQAQEAELRSAAKALRADLGADFDSVTEDLAEILGSGDLQLAVLSSKAPAALARYLTDPSNQAEAEKIGRMGLVQAGMAFAEISAKLKAAESTARPKASKAPAPIEPIKGGQGVSVQPDMSKWTDAQWLEHRRKSGR